MSIESKIRQLARSNYWQTIYNQSKDCSGIYIFENTNNFSGLQQSFLSWLSVYKMLYEELGKHENDKYLTESVINDDLRCDAYLFWRSKKIDFDWKKYQQNKTQSEASRHKNTRSASGKQSFVDVDLRRE